MYHYLAHIDPDVEKRLINEIKNDGKKGTESDGNHVRPTNISLASSESSDDVFENEADF